MPSYQFPCRLRINKWYAKNLLKIRVGFNAHLTNWNKEGTECDAIFYCFDEFDRKQWNRTKEDLEEYVISHFGANIISDNIQTKLDFSQGKPFNTPVETNPFLKAFMEPSARDNYKSSYDIEITKQQLEGINADVRQFYPAEYKDKKVTPIRELANGNYKLRIGQW